MIKLFKLSYNPKIFIFLHSCFQSDRRRAEVEIWNLSDQVSDLLLLSPNPDHF